MSRLLVLSTYELGCQPLTADAAAGLLHDAGHEVRVRDLAVEDWSDDEVDWADGLVCSVPMHTALRLGLAATARARAIRADLPIAWFGLYTPVAVELELLGERDCAVPSSTPGALALWARLLVARDTPVAISPEKTGHPPELERYARMTAKGQEHLVGTVESTVGCNHRCRHCPVPVVFDGRSHAVDAEIVAGKIDRLVEAGASHIHFADPDFLNRPQQARRVAKALFARHPGVTFDATIKVSHLLRHASVLPELARAGLVFVVSAFESTSDLVLERLDKGHRAHDEGRAVQLLRSQGVEVRPSLLPFTPWTTRHDVLEIFDFVASHDLIWNVDPVQFSIRLLLPPGSLLLSDPDPALTAVLGEFDESTLGTSWTSVDPLLDELQLLIARRCEAAVALDEDVPATYAALRELAFSTLDRPPLPLPGLVVSPGPAGATRPRLSEPWFCCAEPTAQQLATVSAVPVTFRGNGTNEDRAE